jgi:hypothetical protein
MENSNATPVRLGYGYVSDSDDGLQTKSGGVFGGNFGNTLLAKFAYNPNTAKEGQPVREAIEVTVKIADREYQDWISPITKVFGANNVELTDPNAPEYITNWNAAITQQNAVVTHYLKAVGVPEESIKNLFVHAPATSFADYANRLCALLPPGYNTRPLDYFLEYQFNFGKKADGSFNDRTFLTIPRNMKGGYFVVPAQVGTWKEERASDGSLKYLNQNGQEHPFTRGANFMSSKKAYEQGGTATAPGANPAASAAPSPAGFQPGNGNAQTSTWNVPPATPQQ